MGASGAALFFLYTRGTIHNKLYSECPFYPWTLLMLFLLPEMPFLRILLILLIYIISYI